MHRQFLRPVPGLWQRLLRCRETVSFLVPVLVGRLRTDVVPYVARFVDVLPRNHECVSRRKHPFHFERDRLRHCGHFGHRLWFVRRRRRPRHLAVVCLDSLFGGLCRCGVGGDGVCLCGGRSDSRVGVEPRACRAHESNRVVAVFTNGRRRLRLLRKELGAILKRFTRSFEKRDTLEIVVDIVFL